MSLKSFREICITPQARLLRVSEVIAVEFRGQNQNDLSEGPCLIRRALPRARVPGWDAPSAIVVTLSRPRTQPARRGCAEGLALEAIPAQSLTGCLRAAAQLLSQRLHEALPCTPPCLHFPREEGEADQGPQVDGRRGGPADQNSCHLTLGLKQHFSGTLSRMTKKAF